MTQSTPFKPSWASAPTPGHPVDALARAEAALKSLAEQFATGLQDEIDKLEAARAHIAVDALSGDAGEALYLCAHDLKGLGSTYAFPIVSRIAGSLCDLLEDPQRGVRIPTALIDAHIAAIKTMVREGVRDELHPMGGSMTAALENQVRAALGHE